MLSSKKGAILGILLSILISVASFHFAMMPHNALDEFSGKDTNWNFSSGLLLSTQIIENAQNVLSISFEAFHITKKISDQCLQVINNLLYYKEIYTPCLGFEAQPEFLFYNYSGYDNSNSINSLGIAYVSQQYELNYLLDPQPGFYQTLIHTPIKDSDEIKLVQPLSMIRLAGAFGKDTAGYNATSSITNREIFDLLSNLSKGDKLWETDIVFTDGTLIKFYYYGQDIIIQHLKISGYYSNKDGGFYTWNTKQDAVTYKTVATTDNPLPNFIQEIYDFYEGIMNG